MNRGLRWSQTETNMKCLVTADLHYSLKQWDWVLRSAGHFDLVILAGDHLDIASVLDTEAQAVVVLKYLVRIGRQVPLLASSGNHDGIERTAANESVATWLQDAREDGVFVDGDTFERGQWRFALYPWWDGPETQAAVGRQMERDAALPPRRSAWVYHAPPDRTRVSWTGKGYFGDPMLEEWIGRYHPELVLSGHVHQSPFRSEGSWVDRVQGAWVFNAGRQIGPEPAFLVLDLESMTAAWQSQAGRETIDLKNPDARPEAATT
jgi:Icc-related predicted phosphoesterase